MGSEGEEPTKSVSDLSTHNYQRLFYNFFGIPRRQPKPSNNLKRAANIFKLDELSSSPAYLSIRRIRPAFPIGAFYCLGHVKLPVCELRVVCVVFVF